MVILIGYFVGLLVGVVAVVLGNLHSSPQLIAHTMLRYFLPVGVGC